MRVIQAVLVLVLVSLSPVLAEDDSECLEAVKQSLIDSTGYLSNWIFGNSTAGYVCNFVGVQCWHQGENKVFSLKLSGGSLTGNFPKGLNKCTGLQQLDLSDNHLEGSIPSDICIQLPYLTGLDLSQNRFTASIPDNLGACTYLNQLRLQQNQLSGEIPWQIGVLPRLTDLNLSDNDLVGAVPSSFTNRTEINQQAFKAEAFQGNSGLCGPVLSKSCASSSSSYTALIAGIAVGGTVGLLFFVFFAWWIYRGPPSNGRAALKDEHRWAKHIKAPWSITVSMFEKPLVKIRLSDLMAATNNFSKDNIIGSGRTGTVYKATLLDGSVMAIKRLPISDQSEKQFKAEMSTLGQFRHRNLVPLLGYCIAGGEKLLVYKHMVNGSLRDCLHDVPNEAKLNWATRLKIGIGAARALAWLHHSCNPRIIHRNISVNSILLDEEYEPRITDFGLARLLNPVDTHVSTFINGDFGDVGYVAPEYIRTLVATVKGDVYSFGVVLLELVTGQKAIGVCGDGDFKGNLGEWIIYLSNNGRIEEAIDKSLKGKGADDELVQFLRIACCCIISSPKERPTMYELYQLLRAIGQKYNFTDQNDEIPFATDSTYAGELIVAKAK